MSETRTDWVPWILMGIFAVFWSAWDIYLGLYAGVIPSILILAVMGAKVLRKPDEEAS